MINNKGFDTCKEAMLAMQDSIDIWGTKWKIMIMIYLSSNVDTQNYFMQIKRDLSGISAKMLSKELKDLELNKLITRTSHDGKPVTVEYAITEYGSSFVEIAKELGRWGLKHREFIKGNQVPL